MLNFVFGKCSKTLSAPKVGARYVSSIRKDRRRTAAATAFVESMWLQSGYNRGQWNRLPVVTDSSNKWGNLTEVIIAV